MRTFHSGGVAVGVNKRPFIESRAKGILHYVDLRVVEDTDGNFVVLNKNGSISIRDKRTDGARVAQNRDRFYHFR